MGLRILGVLVLAVILGLITSLILDRPSAGLGAFAATAIVGIAAAVPQRGRGDRTHGQGGIPVPVFQIVEDDQAPREPR